MTKSLLTIIAFTLVSTLAFSQAFTIGDPSKTYMYQTDAYLSDLYNTCLFNDSCFTGHRVDSIDSTGVNTIYYFNKFLRDTGDYSYCAEASWMGEYAVVEPGGGTSFYNKWMEEIYIQPFSASDEWVIYSDGGSTEITAYLDKEYSATIYGELDEVKEYILSSGNGGEALEGARIILSKKFGLLQTVDFYNFPLDGTPIRQVGFNNSDERTLNLTSDKIYDFNVGDEFHRQFYYGAWDFVTEGEEITTNWTVLEKSVSNNLDTISYVIDEYAYTWRMSDFTTTDSIYTRDTIDVTYIVSELKQFEKVPLDINDAYSVQFTESNTMFKTIDSDWSAYDNCINLPVGCGAGQKTYGEHLGLSKFNFSCHGASAGESLVYYKKGDEEWGEPVYLEGIVNSVSNLEASSIQINIYPNPVNDILNISLTQNSTGTLQLVDVSGKTILKDSFRNKTEIQLNLSGFAAGMYVLQIKTGDQTKHLKVFKK
ncbi:MAG: T9SS type A sorting domain-containing protein [Flavobacteriales bacterium]|nr:T9SS type A sorting domain-containing protein [Flavobacteriales bacterium]